MNIVGMTNTLMKMLVAIALTTAMVGCFPESGPLKLAERGGEAKYAISVPKDASVCITHAAEEFRDYVKKITGTELAIMVGGDVKEKHAIKLRSKAKMGDDDFRFAVENRDFVIEGASDRAVLFGVYDFLENQCGCEWLSAVHEIVPTRQSIEVPENFSLVRKPKMRIRECGWTEPYSNPDFAAKLKVTGYRYARIYGEKQGGKPPAFDSVLGICHTFFRILPPEKYFKDHPEWYSEVNGRREAGKSQLCLSNPEVLKKTIEFVRNRIKKSYPSVKAYGISQNDWHNYCTCAKCKAIDEREGGPAGTIINFVNKVAEDIEKDYPDVMIETLAYLYSRQAPKNLKCRDNVMVTLCTDTCDMSKPMEGNRFCWRGMTPFYKDLKSWGEKCKHVYVWDYAFNFRFMNHAFPNLWSIGPNIKYYADCGVDSLYMEGAHHGRHAESAEVKLWLTAHLMWDPYQDPKALLKRFFTHYFGPAAKYAEEYYAEMEKLQKDERKTPQMMWGSFNSPVMSDEFFEKAAKLWDAAMAAVKGDKQREYNVRWAQNANDYTRIGRDNLGACWECTRHPEYVNTPRFKELQAAAKRILKDVKDDKWEGRLGEDSDGNMRAERKVKYLAELDPSTVKAAESVKIPGDFLSFKGTHFFFNDVHTDKDAKYRLRVKMNLKRKPNAPAKGMACNMWIRGTSTFLNVDITQVKDGFAWYELPGSFGIKPDFELLIETDHYDHVKYASNPYIEAPKVECIELSFADAKETAKRETITKLFDVKEGTDFYRRDFFWHWTQFKVHDDGFDVTIAGKKAIIENGPYHRCAPFRGPKRVTLKVDKTTKEGEVVLKLREHLKPKSTPIEYKAAWKTPMTVIEVNGDYNKEYDFVMIEFHDPHYKKPYVFRVEQVNGEWDHGEADSFSLKVDAAGSKLYTIDWESDKTATAIIRNESETAAKAKGALRVYDFYGHDFSIPLDLNLKSGEEHRVTIPRDKGKADSKGVWRIDLELVGEDGVKAKRNTRFAILDAHPVTPKVPYGKFRAGIHLHTARYITEEEQLTMDAAVRMGSKIVRVDSYFSNYELWDSKKKAHDFTRADKCLKDLEDRGLAVDALCCGCLSLKNPHFTEEFCRQLASRYQDRIDYYEIGNEWDLLDKKVMTPEQGVELQKKAYTWLRSGYKKARITTNGWAVEDSNGHANVTQKGFQEYFMREAKGYYDIHAMHLHFTYANYVDRLSRFFKLRQNEKVTEPWILNETALNFQYRSEEEVAENVWMKIIYGWTKGAKDYVWYNMRASGYDPWGSYGVIRHDFTPRLTFAAFSGFTACLGDHDLDRQLVDREGRFVSRFKRRGDKKEIVIAGWDTGATEAPAKVAVKTNAKRVYVADIMNNRVELPVKGGKVTITITGKPQAWVFEGATFAEPDAKQIANVKKAPPRVIIVRPVRPDYGWDLHLVKYSQVHEEYPADPATAHRTWKGTDDCSGDFLYKMKDGKVLVHITVRDEKDAPGDRVEVWRDGKNITDQLGLKRVRHGDKRTTYDGVWPDTKSCRLNFRIIDDDGFGGIDGWMDYTPFDAKKIDLDKWPVVRFE